MGFFEKVKGKYEKYQEDSLKSKEKKIKFLRRKNKVDTELAQMRLVKSKIQKERVDNFTKSLLGESSNPKEEKRDDEKWKKWL